MHSKHVTFLLSLSRSRSFSIKAAGLCNDLFTHTCTHPQKQYLPTVCLLSHTCQQLSAGWYFFYTFFSSLGGNRKWGFLTAQCTMCVCVFDPWVWIFLHIVILSGVEKQFMLDYYCIIYSFLLTVFIRIFLCVWVILRWFLLLLVLLFVPFVFSLV